MNLRALSRAEAPIFVLALALFVTGQAHAATMQECEASVCQNAAAGISIKAYMDLENTDHPDLEKLYARYGRKIQEVRVVREKKVRESIRVMSQSENITASIKKLNDRELFALFLEYSPWNVDTGFKDGKLVPIANALWPEQQNLVGAIFDRVKLVSPIYLANLKSQYLNVEPREALGLKAGESLSSAVTAILNTEIDTLPAATRNSYKQKLGLGMGKIKQYVSKYGEKVYLALGSFEIEFLGMSGKIKMTAQERPLVEKAMMEAFSTVVQSQAEGIANLDSKFTPATWEKSCRKAYNRALHYGLTQAEADYASKELKAEAIRRSKATLDLLFNPPLTAQLMTYVQSMTVAGPPSFTDYIKQTEDSFIAALEKPSERTLVDHYHEVRGLGGDNDDELENICNSFFYEPIRDQVSGNYVILSSYSAKFQNVGLGITIHEMGHVMSVALDLFKKSMAIAPYDDIRACISENYAQSGKVALYDFNHFRGDKLWSEEDWADAFAAFSMRDLKTNALCGFAGSLPGRDYSPLAQRDDDPHSPSFYRILNTHAHLGEEAPPVCKEVLKTQYPGEQFKDCISRFTYNR